MSKLAICLSTLFAAAAVQAQTTNISSGSSQLGTSGLSITNRSGQTFSVDQLASQLRQLRADVDQSLPVITAFNESTAASSSSLGGKLSSLLSNGNSGQNSTVSNVVSALRGLLGNNASGPTFNPNTLHDLATLQDHLKAIAPILQELNMGTATNTSPGSQVISSSPAGRYGETNANQTTPTPTGR